MTNLVDRDNINITEGFYYDNALEMVCYVSADSTSISGFRFSSYFEKNISLQSLVASTFTKLQSPQEKEKELRRKADSLIRQADFIASKLEELAEKE